nr:reverse transcriptase domain-containing protein [Tanacetum cinerariifolium]
KNTSLVESDIQTNAKMADERTMAQMLQAPIEGYEDPIVVPLINANNFELKQTLINLVQSNQFTGRQDPHNHLCFFNKYPDVQENPLTNDEFEAFMKANNDKINNLETEFDHFQKQCEQMQDDLLNQMRNFIQNFQSGPPGEDKEHEATTDTELLSTEDIHPLAIQEPPQESDICQLIEECFVEVPEQQKQNMEKTMLDLVKICHHKQFLCIHDDVDDLMESALDSKLLSINSINSQRLDKKEQEVKIVEEQPAERRNHVEKSLQNFRVIRKSSISLKDTSQISSIHSVAPILSTKEPENSLSMGYEHFSITPETESDEVTESNAENLLPILSECEVTLEDKRESIVSVEEENVVQQEEEEVDLEEISQIQDVVLREKLFSFTRLISNIESLKENSTPDRVLNSFKSDNSLLDNFSLEFETFCDHSEETRSGNTTHANYSLPEYDSFCFEIEPEEADLFLSDDSIPPGIKNGADDPEGDIRFLEELLIDDSILSHESFDSNFEDNPSISRPPPEPPDAETHTGEEIPVVMNDKEEDVDYSYFMFVIFDKMFSLLFVKSEDTIFDPGISD